MKLSHSATSPYVRKVMLVLHETGQINDVELISTTGTPLSPAAGLAARNPLGKVPALERSDGPTLYDSRVICRYLDARANAGLYGVDPGVWEMLTLEATADGILDAALSMAYEWRLRPEQYQYADWTKAQWLKISQSLDRICSHWMGHLEAPLNIGQLSVAAALGYLDLRNADREWRQGRDALADWFGRFCARDSMSATQPVI